MFAKFIADFLDTGNYKVLVQTTFTMADFQPFNFNHIVTCILN